MKLRKIPVTSLTLLKIFTSHLTWRIFFSNSGWFPWGTQREKNHKTSTVLDTIMKQKLREQMLSRVTSTRVSITESFPAPIMPHYHASTMWTAQAWKPAHSPDLITVGTAGTLGMYPIRNSSMDISFYNLHVSPQINSGGHVFPTDQVALCGTT